MKNARDLLKSSQFPLTQFASRWGYTFESSFSKAFKRQFNQNPGTIRRQSNIDSI